MKKYNLFNTDGETFFDFRSNPESRCEGFTVSFLDDGTVVMSGDYGCLCWKRNYNHEGKKEFNRDYGFPNKETGIGYFAEKVNQFGIPQKIEEWNKELAITELKEEAKNYEFENKEEYKDALEEIEWLEEYQDQKFWDIISDKLNDCDLWECRFGQRYTSQFKFIFNILQGVSKQILNAVEINIKKGEFKIK